MDNKAQIDQIVTSLIVLFLAVALSILFVIISGYVALAKGSGVQKAFEAPYVLSGESRAFGNLFMTDYIEVLGGKVAVTDALSIVASAVKQKKLNDEYSLALLNSLQNLFMENYSCDKRNELYLLVRDPSDGTGKKYGIYLRLPTDKNSHNDLNPRLVVNIVDLVNDENAGSYDYTFIDGLKNPPIGNYRAYPVDVDLVEERPDYIVLLKGASLC